MRLSILAFGIVKEIFGASKIELECSAATVDALQVLLEEKYPRLKQIASYMLAVNNQYARKETPIFEDDEIAVIPPVSGG